MSVQGPRAIAALCLRCLAVLVVVNVVGFAVAALVSHDGVSASGVYILVVGLLVACVPIALVGWPAGVLTARVLAGTEREWVHVVVFALVGAILSVTLVGMIGTLSVVPWYTLVAAAEGAIGAGVARWWSGRVQAGRTRWTEEEGAALPWGKMTP